jgi:hypothetical protein
MRSLRETLEFFGLLDCSAFTWLCSISSWLVVVAELSLGTCLSFGCRSDAAIRTHEVFLLASGGIATLIAPLAWCILVAIPSCRIAVGAHFVQVILFFLGWLLSIPAVGFTESQGLPGWFLD